MDQVEVLSDEEIESVKKQTTEEIIKLIKKSYAHYIRVGVPQSFSEFVIEDIRAAYKLKEEG